MNRASTHGNTIVHNRQYNQSEQKIQKAILKLLRAYRGRITARQVAKAAGLSRQTIYNHHANLNQAIDENEDALLRDFSDALNTDDGRLVRLVADVNGRAFYSMLIFMAQRRELFCPICMEIHYQGILYRMAEVLYAKLEIDWLPKGMPAPAIGSERADMLVRMTVEVVSKWGVATECDIRRAGRYVNRWIRVVSDAAKKRLP